MKLWIRTFVAMMKAHDSWILRLDRKSVKLFARLRARRRAWNQIFRVLARYGPGLLFAEMAALLAWSLATDRAVFPAVCLSVLTAVVSALCTKIVIDQLARRLDRARPFVSLGYEPLIAKNPKDPSFPSNHAGGAFALGTSLALSFPHIMAVSFCLALLIVLARLYAGLHYLTDVVAGGTIGAVVAVVWWLLLYRVL